MLFRDTTLRAVAKRRELYIFLVCFTADTALCNRPGFESFNSDITAAVFADSKNAIFDILQG